MIFLEKLGSLQGLPNFFPQTVKLFVINQNKLVDLNKIYNYEKRK